MRHTGRNLGWNDGLIVFMTVDVYKRQELYISGDAFAKDWIKKVRNDVLDAPILVTAGGLFHYFEEHKAVSYTHLSSMTSVRSSSIVLPFSEKCSFTTIFVFPLLPMPHLLFFF